MAFFPTLFKQQKIKIVYTMYINIHLLYIHIFLFSIIHCGNKLLFYSYLLILVTFY